MKIWAHCLICNEENFLWFAVESVIDFVDKILLWDTGSDDKTFRIIKLLKKKYPKKIDIKEIGKVTKEEFPKIRQKMLKETKSDWIMILDGDEIWWENSLKKIIRFIKVNKVNGLAVPFYMSVGDIYHYQDKLAGRYKIKGKTGHYTLRFINRKINGLHVDLPYGQEGYYDFENRPVQEMEKIVFLDAPYLHVSHLIRSSLSQNQNKIKHELGIEFNNNFKYPEVFYMRHPDIVPSPFQKMSKAFYIKSLIITPLRRTKRILEKKIIKV